MHCMRLIEKRTKGKSYYVYRYTVHVQCSSWGRVAGCCNKSGMGCDAMRRDETMCSAEIRQQMGPAQCSVLVGCTHTQRHGHVGVTHA